MRRRSWRSSLSIARSAPRQARRCAQAHLFSRRDRPRRYRRAIRTETARSRDKQPLTHLAVRRPERRIPPLAAPGPGPSKHSILNTLSRRSPAHPAVGGVFHRAGRRRFGRLVPPVLTFLSFAYSGCRTRTTAIRWWVGIRGHHAECRGSRGLVRYGR